MEKKLYIEGYSGISGDMAVAAFLDLGVNKEMLIHTLAELKIQDEFEIKITKVKKQGIEASDFDVILKYKEEHHHHHDHRNLEDIFKIIDRLQNEEIKQLAKKIFEIVAKAEAKAHGVSIEEVHFHEVGAVDSIIDIVSTAFCLIYLEIKEVIVSTLYEGCGFQKCAHGLMPVPVPAVANILQEYHLPIKITENEGEQITPTGAAIIAAIKTKDKLPEEYAIAKIGLGAGKRYPDRSNMLRIMLIEE